MINMFNVVRIQHQNHSVLLLDQFLL